MTSSTDLKPFSQCRLRLLHLLNLLLQNVGNQLRQKKRAQLVFTGPLRPWSTLREIRVGVELLKALVKIHTLVLQWLRHKYVAFKEVISHQVRMFLPAQSTLLHMAHHLVVEIMTKLMFRIQNSIMFTCHRLKLLSKLVLKTL